MGLIFLVDPCETNRKISCLTLSLQGCSLADHKDAFIRLDIAGIGFGMACERFDMLWLFHSVR